MITLMQGAIGLLFGLGLVISGMGNPAKVLGFLDLSKIGDGIWDPSLALVMASALLVTGIGFRLVFRRGKPLFADRFDLPTRQFLDARLLGGAALFGIGWGLVGFCPGPAFTALSLGSLESALFVFSMMVGMALARRGADRP